MATQDLLLSTHKKMNYALATKNYEVAYSLLEICNSIRKELGLQAFRLRNLEARFSNK